METKRIRQLAVETVVNNRDSVDTKLITMMYVVGGNRTIPLNGKEEIRTISNIIASKNHYTLYIADGASAQEWKQIPKSRRVTIDFFID